MRARAPDLLCPQRQPPDETLLVVRLLDARADMADMRTVVIVGNSQTRQVGKHVYTPRSYEACSSAPLP
jgi:precorrin-3B C17-methyltransferase